MDPTKKARQKGEGKEVGGLPQFRKKRKGVEGEVKRAEGVQEPIHQKMSW